MGLSQTAHAAPIHSRDDRGHAIKLDQPARRAITLAPHATELVYAAGAGEFLIATVGASDYPAQALDLPRIGDGLNIDAERIASVNADLLITWQSAMVDALRPTLEKMGTTLYFSDPQTLESIPDAIERLGQVFGTQTQARENAGALRQRLEVLKSRFTPLAPVRVFIQAGQYPLYTLNRYSFISDAVELCGGVNIFADAPVLVPQVTLESVLAAKPEAILSGVSSAAEATAHQQDWRSYGLDATQGTHLIQLDADSLYRPGPRLIDATEQLCTALNAIRETRERRGL